LVMPSLEVYEQLYPVRYRRCEFRRDGGGPGQWRGGTGVEYEIDVHTEGTWSFRGEGLRYRSGYGVASGRDGEGGEMEVHPTDAPPFEAPKFGLRDLGPSRLVVSSPGGGGFGDPFDRDPERVLRDVRDGVVSVEAAREHYGVDIAPGGRRINANATVRRRKLMRGAVASDSVRS
ncbi:MAG: hydantoinase B/oxoprolinase family protein, partial [Gammaproteobacteria bacterium]|nr:hydantoinase B/oxoprolinase family protein [Gammaproteobacteria bacterium]